MNQNEIIIENRTPQDITIRQNDNQEIIINGGSINVGITDVLVNDESVVTNNIAYIEVPTKTSELINNSGFLTLEQDPTVPSFVKNITQANINSWNNKQNALVSGVSIKTINSNSLLGSGNINITGTQYSAGTGIDITNNVITNEITSYNDLTDLPTIPTKTSDLINNNDFVSENELADVAFSGSYVDLSNTPEIPTDLSELDNDVGYITKSVNDLTNYTLTSNLSNVALSGDYADLINTPSIPTVNNGTLTIQVNGTTVNSFTANSNTDVTTNITVPTTTNELTNNSGFLIATELFKATGDLASITSQNSITLNDSYSNYKYLEVYYCRYGTFSGCVKINPTMQNNAIMSSIVYSNSILRLYTTTLSFSTTTITLSDKALCNNLGTISATENNLIIYNVIGYK